MEHTAIVEKNQIILAGFSFFGDPFSLSGAWTEENEIGRLWKRFMKYVFDEKNQIKCLKNRLLCYEVHIQHDETCETGEYEIFAGTEIEKIEDVSIELLIKILPPTKYAVFTLRGHEIISDWNFKIFQEWLPKSGYEIAYNYSIQLYDNRFKGMDKIDESIIDVYIPVK